MKHSKLLTGLFALGCAAGAAGWWSQRSAQATARLARPLEAVASGAPVRSESAAALTPRSSALDSSSPAPAALAVAAAAPEANALSGNAGDGGDEGTERGAAADFAEPAPPLATALAALAEALPELRPELRAYEQAVERARADTDDYERRMQELQRATLEGRLEAGDERLLERRRDELMERAHALGQQAMLLNQAIRRAAGVGDD